MNLMKIFFFQDSDAWLPLKNDQNQFIQVDMGEPTPIYGIYLEGSEVYSSFITSFKILYGDDGYHFSYIVDQNGEEKVVNIFFHIEFITNVL